MPHRPSTAIVVSVLAFALIASACSNSPGDQDSTPSSEGGGTAEGSTQERDTDSEETEAALGTVIVDGTEYPITEVRDCVPLEQAGVERELELQGRGDSGDETVQIDAYVQTIGGMAMDSVSWSGPEGVFGADQEVVLEVLGDQVTGSAVLTDALRGTETISVEFTLSIPSESVDCHV